VTVTISRTCRSSAPGLRARNIICPAVSRNISTSEYSPTGKVKASRTFVRMSAFKCTASVRFKAVSPRRIKRSFQIIHETVACRPILVKYAFCAPQATGSASEFVNAGAKMHRPAGAKIHHGARHESSRSGGFFFRHQAWVGLSVGVSGLARRAGSTLSFVFDITSLRAASRELGHRTTTIWYQREQIRRGWRSRRCQLRCRSSPAALARWVCSAGAGSGRVPPLPQHFARCVPKMSCPGRPFSNSVDR
jgi:hypothetical protein